MMKLSTFKFLPIVGVLLLTGCVNLAPQYERPEAPIPQSWPQGLAYQHQPEAQQSLLSWSEFYQDERLREVIGLALKNNRDAKIAALNVKKLEALYGVSRSALVPQANLGFNEQATRTPKGMSPMGEPMISHTYTTQLPSLSYEVDFFGRVRNMNEQALQAYLASKEGSITFENALIAQVAQLWLKIGADRDLLKTQQSILEAQKKNVSMVEDSLKAGATTELALEQARSTLMSLQADVHASVRQEALDLSALNLLCAHTVDDALLPKTLLNEAVGQATLLAGTPSDVLLNRPDIKAAENNLKGANANIGVARAAFFPRVNLVASVGTMSASLSNLFDAQTGMWSFTPSISLPIFTGGRNLAQLKAAKIDKEIAVAQYEKAIQSAFKETSDALAQLGTADNEYKAREALANTNKRAYELAKLRYDKGASSYLDVLTNQNAYIRSIQGAINAKLGMIMARVNLYKALGGGLKP